MRNGKHYVAVRLTKDEKEQFDRMYDFCGMPKKTLLYHLVSERTLGEKVPEKFIELNRLLLRLDINMGHLWLTNRISSEEIKNKYYRLSKEFNRINVVAFKKLLFKNPYYREDQKKE